MRPASDLTINLTCDRTGRSSAFAAELVGPMQQEPVVRGLSGTTAPSGLRHRILKHISHHQPNRDESLAENFRRQLQPA